MTELAAIISKEIGKPVEYRRIDRKRKDVEAEFLKRFGTPNRWLDDDLSADAYNNGVVRFYGDAPPLRPQLPTKMEAFIRDVWKPRYLQSVASEREPETFYTWSAKPEL
jgi:hypothetical protein